MGIELAVQTRGTAPFSDAKQHLPDCGGNASSGKKEPSALKQGKETGCQTDSIIIFHFTSLLEFINLKKKSIIIIQVTQGDLMGEGLQWFSGFVGQRGFTHIAF